VIFAAAKSDFEIILYIAAAVWGVISWWRNRKAEQQQPPLDTDDGSDFRPQSPAPRPIQQGESEQERMRRFLEALGVPAGQQPSPPIIPAPAPRPKRAPASSPTTQRPAAPVRPFEQATPRPQPKPRQPIHRPVAKPVLVEPEEIPLAGRLEEPASAIEKVGTSFDSMARGIPLEPVAELDRPQEVIARAVVDGAVHANPSAVSGKAIHALLRSSESLRAALVVKEVLGPPRCETI
jgi:hypothetical protein